MAGEWQEGRPADFADVVMGTSPPGATTNEVGQGSPLLNGPTEFTSHSPVAVQYTTAPVKLCEPGDIPFWVRGSTTGRMNWADRQYAIGRGLAAIRHREGIQYQRYVRAVVEYGLLRLLAVATGSTFPSVSRYDIENVTVRVLPLREQQAIAYILGALDDKIELNRRRNRTLEALARAIFQSWFVDFDPVKMKSDVRRVKGEINDSAFPSHFTLFPSNFEDSPLGPIPAGWRAGTLGEIATESRDSVSPTDIDADTPYIALEHIPRRCLTLDSWGTANGVAGGKLRFCRGDILFGKLRPYFHKVGPAPIDGVCSTDIVVARPLRDIWYGVVLGHMASDAFVAHTHRGSTGTKMPRTKWRDMAAYDIALPCEPLAGEFTRLVEPMLAKIRAAIMESRALTALRDTLLPKLISGELRIADAERIVGRCV